MQGFHELVSQDPLTRHTTNMDLAREVRSHGIRVLNLWMDNHPFDGDVQPFCYDLHDTGDGDWWCEYDGLEWDHLSGQYLVGESHPQFEDMIRFWREAPIDVVFVRFQRYGYNEGACMAKTFPPYYAIAKRLYEIAGDRALTVVFADWEEDWWPWGCDDGDGDSSNYEWPFKWWWSAEDLEWCLSEHTEDECGIMVVEDRFRHLMLEIERRQVEVERARREAYIKLGHRPELRVMTSVVVNRYPHNIRPHEEGSPTLAERIGGLKRRPDLIGLSYWTNGHDPVETLDWLRSVTNYPGSRIYINEFGADESRQARRFSEYIPAFWEWGVRTINIWMWRQTWCDENHNKGLWKQAQPCDGKVEWGDPTDGYYVVRDLNSQN
jgi:hypothetical protein